MVRHLIKEEQEQHNENMGDQGFDSLFAALPLEESLGDILLYARSFGIVFLAARRVQGYHI